MPEMTARIASILVAVAFAWAGIAKIAAYRRWRNVLERYGLPKPVRTAAAPAVPLFELAVAAVVLFVSPRVGAIVAVATLAAFSLAIMRARALQGDRLPCGCFGGSSERNYQTMIVRNALLGTLATIVVISRIESAIELPSAPSASDALPVGLVVVGIALAIWISLQAGSHLRHREHP